MVHGNCLKQGAEESWAVCRGKTTNPEDVVNCPLLSHKAGNQHIFALGGEDLVQTFL